jgi:hypothetical protein
VATASRGYKSARELCCAIDHQVRLPAPRVAITAGRRRGTFHWAVAVSFLLPGIAGLSSRLRTANKALGNNLHWCRMTILLKETSLDFCGYLIQPPFGVLSSVLIMAEVRLKFLDAILSDAKFPGKLVNLLQGIFTVFFSHPGRSAK